jgi:hypothetical protein
MVQFAADNRAAFSRVDFSYYPGIFLPVPPSVAAALAEFFNVHARRRFDARRMLQMHCRLSMVTLPPRDLHPTQCLCHRDQPLLDARHSIQACILYLFRDANLGGTSFYEPARSEEEIRRLSIDAQHVGRVAAKWNRSIFFDGYTLHSGDIPQPQRLSDDPLTGRLTFNGFFTSRRHLR